MAVLRSDSPAPAEQRAKPRRGEPAYSESC